MSRTYHFRNLVFEGGGVKGIAYVGALEELEQRGILDGVARIGGTSAGAINAVLLATGHTLKETLAILSKLDFKGFLDESWGLVRDSRRLIENFGWYKGDFFREWIGQLIESKAGNRNATFNDLSNLGFKDLYLVGTNISTGYSEVFSAEHTPRTCVADAARISMSIPLFFAAIRSARRDVYVDGGLLDNYAVKLFDREKYLRRADRKRPSVTTEYYKADNRRKPKSSSRYVYNKETLGFRLDAKVEVAMFRDASEPPVNDIADFFDFGWALIKAALNAQDNAHLHSDDWQRTVYIDTLGVGTTEFDLAESRKQALIRSGAEGVKAYFDWYDNAKGAALPANHPRYRAR